MLKIRMCLKKTNSTIIEHGFNVPVSFRERTPSRSPSKERAKSKSRSASKSPEKNDNSP